jgi:hypothetical protein
MPAVTEERVWPGRRGYLLPVGAWAAAALTVVCAAALDGHSPLKRATWMHWDAFQYLDQAAHGYTLFHCNLFGGLERWCGNAGWFPGYPWLIRAASLAGVDGFPAAMVLA